MLNPNMNYPYPVIRVSEEDYRTTIFNGDLTVNLQPDGYLVRPAFEINNTGVATLIEEGKLTYAIEIQSPSTWYYVRHGIARLYWSVYLTYDENNDNPYEYTELLFNKQDVLVNIGERSYGRNKTIALAAMKELKKYPQLS